VEDVTVKMASQLEVEVSAEDVILLLQSHSQETTNQDLFDLEIIGGGSSTPDTPPPPTKRAMCLK
jgi:hypothetical protein